MHSPLDDPLATLLPSPISSVSRRLLASDPDPVPREVIGQNFDGSSILGSQAQVNATPVNAIGQNLDGSFITQPPVQSSSGSFNAGALLPLAGSLVAAHSLSGDARKQALLSGAGSSVGTFLGGPVGGFVGGLLGSGLAKVGKKNPRKQSREDFRGSLEAKGVPLDIPAILDMTNPLSAQAIAFADPLAEFLTAGSPNSENREDLSNVMAQRILFGAKSEADLRNNTLAIAQRLGLDRASIIAFINQNVRDPNRRQVNLQNLERLK